MIAISLAYSQTLDDNRLTMKVTSVFVWVYVIRAVFSASPSVTDFEPRHNLTVPVTLSRNVTFVCTVDASGTTIPIWEVAISQYPNSQLPLTGREIQSDIISTAFEMLGIVMKEINMQNSTLDITEVARRNNTLIQVQCSAFDTTEASCASGNCSTAIYYIITYGVPDPPQNLALQASSISPSLPPVLSWQRPPNIPEDVPLTYHLQITNLTSNERVLNMIETLSYPLPGGTGCSLFTFSVTASNDVGNSTTISIMETVPITPDVGPINSSLRILSVDVSEGSAAVTLAFDEAEVCSERYRVIEYTVVSSDGSINVSINASSDVNNYTVTLDSANSPNLTQGFAYDISVIACNNLTCRESKTIEVFTTDVQNPSVRYVNNSINLTCEFAEGSTAEGCLFNFTGVTTEQTFFVNRSANSPVASTCVIARAFANNTDYMWSAFDDIGGVPVTVELIAVDSQDEGNFTCLSLLPGPGGVIPAPPDQIPAIVGGTVGGIVGGLLLMGITVTVILSLWCVRKRNRENEQKKSEEDTRQKEFPPTTRPDSDQEEIELSVEDEKEPLLTCTMKVLSKEKGLVEFQTVYHQQAIKKRILASRPGEEITVKGVKM